MTIDAAKKTLSFWQSASVVIREGEESYTANSNQNCYNESMKAKGEKPLTSWQWREFAGQWAHRGRLWKMMRREQHVREMGDQFCRERDRVNMFRKQAEEERQAGMQGQWQLESPAREYLEQVRCCNDTDCTHRMMKQCLCRPEKWRLERT